MCGMSGQGLFDISGVINTAGANKQGICVLSHAIKAEWSKTVGISLGPSTEQQQMETHTGRHAHTHARTATGPPDNQLSSDVTTSDSPMQTYVAETTTQKLEAVLERINQENKLGSIFLT